MQWTRLFLVVMIFTFGVGSWLGINAIFAQIGVFVESLPEKKAIASQLNIALQSSNALLIIYLLYIYCLHGKNREELFVFLSLGTSCVCLFLVAFFWHSTALIGSKLHSVGLLALTLALGCSNTMSSPIFLPILPQYPASFTSVFAAGEAATALVPALFALIQEASGLSVQSYFIIIACIQLVSCGAYAVLRFLPQSVQLRSQEQLAKADAIRTINEDEETAPLTVDLGPTEPKSILPQRQRMKELAIRVWSELFVTFWLNWLENGVLMAILTYAVLPYGPVLYRAALWGGMTASPMGSLLTLVVKVGKTWFWSIFFMSTGVFLIVNSCVPALPGNAAFGGFVVFCVIVTRFLTGYTKALIYIRVQIEDTDSAGGMLMVAVVQQVGAMVGGLLFFFLINYTSIYV
jgi:hypothetical protein